MQLTIIPDDPDEPTTDIIVLTKAEKATLGLSMTAWSLEVTKYGSGGKDLKAATDGTVSDVAGWSAVLWCDDEDGDNEEYDYGEVITAGEIDDVSQAGQHYTLTLIPTRSDTPDFFNTS